MPVCYFTQRILNGDMRERGGRIGGECGRSVLCSCSAALALFCTPTARSQAPTGLAAVRVATGLNLPLFAIAPAADYNRLFIVHKGGQIRILNLSTGTLNPTAFLDVSAHLSTVSEQGLLGLAFDPSYATNGKFYLNFVVPGGSFGHGTTHVSQFQVSAGNADVADPTSMATIGTVNEKLLVAFDHPANNHNGGWIGFSPRSNDDHNLYIATGDGGNGYDQGNGHIEPGGNAQNVTTLLGKMLRLHVDPTTGTASIPSTNPFFGSPTNRQEIFCYGLRNPFRDSFDRLTGRMFLGDVGQDTREEIDVQTNPGGSENYEWRLREGLIATPGSVGGARPSGGVEPIVDYPHSGSGITGNCVTGGYIYRGKQIPSLLGTYIFSDYIAGGVFTLNYDGTSASNFQDITSQLFPTSVGNFTLSGPASFGEDANGEVYIVDLNGNIFKIIPVTPNVKINSVTKLANGHILLQGTGVPFKNHAIQTSPDLLQFSTPGTVVAAAGDGSITFDDPTPGGARFYRIVYPPPGGPIPNKAKRR